MTPAQIKEMEESANKLLDKTQWLFDLDSGLLMKRNQSFDYFTEGYAAAMEKAEVLVKALEKLIPDQGIHLYGSEELRLIVKQWRGE